MKPWQIGVVVDDLGSAMEDIGEAMGLTWMSTQREIDVIHEGERKQITLRFAIATEGPVHIELIEGQEDTPWWPPHGFDHIAFWTDDLADTAESLEASGYVREVSYEHADSEPVGFTYHRSPSGLRVEHVDAARRDAMLAWISGGSYPDIGGSI